MLFDTHCHLNFKAFKDRVKEVIGEAHEAGVDYMTVVGTDEETSKKAVEIAEKYEGVYAAVGIHPHHAIEQKIGGSQGRDPDNAQALRSRGSIDGKEMTDRIYFLEKILSNKKVVAIGEVGIDKHVYQNTKYQNYEVDKEFIEKQKQLFDNQIRLAIQHNKSLIIHNRRSGEDILVILSGVWDKKMEYKTVFHCCEPDKKLL